jgi:uncharacterized protein YcfL
MKHLLFVLTLTLSLAACRSTPEKAAVHEAGDASVDSKIVQLDPRIVGSGSARAVEFTLQNTSDDSVVCAFTVDWFDAHGVRVPLSSHAWQRVELDARASQSVRVAPMPAEATSWRLQFQGPKR